MRFQINDQSTKMLGMVKVAMKNDGQLSPIKAPQYATNRFRRQVGIAGWIYYRPDEAKKVRVIRKEEA